MHRRLFVFSLALILIAFGTDAARADSSKLDPLARRSLAMVRAGASGPTMRRLSASVNLNRELEVFITGDVSRAELEAAGARVRTELPGIFTASLPVSAIDAVAALPGVRRIRGAGRVKPNLNASVATTGAPSLRGSAPTFTGLNGEGVIIGDVDSGVDYDHGDFKNPDGTTRLLNIWDQNDGVGPAPAGFGYGSEWGSAAINAHTARETDADGHGTHVLGIAGGDGSQTGGAVPAFTYVGMAPRADLIMVSTDFSDVGVVDGVSYIMNRATALGKNAVVNLSLGSLYGPKDGTSPFDAAINALTGPGRLVVVAAGNNGNTPIHAEVIAPAGGSAVSTMDVSTTAAGAYVAIDGYYTASETLSVVVTPPRGPVIGPIALGALNGTYPGPLTTAGNVYVENGVYLTANGDREVYIEINIPDPNGTNANPTGTWSFAFVRPSGGGGSGHDETTENLTGAQWSALAATPGTVAGGIAGSHLLISEVGMHGVNSATVMDSTEFLEIHNPTTSAIDLTEYYLCDVNAYATLPVAGTISLSGINTDFAMRFPGGASIPAGGTKVIAVDGGRFKRNSGQNADFMMFNAGGGTTALPMTSVATNTGTGYPGFGSLTNTGEFVWLFKWDGQSDLVCDVDLVYWGSPTGANVPNLKAGLCQDGPDAGSTTSCYAADAGNPAGSLGKPLGVPSSGSGTRQRTGPEGAETAGGNGCSDGPPPPPPSGGPAEVDLWIYATSEVAEFVLGVDPTHELVSEPGTAPDVITVGAWVTKTSWVDCGGRTVSFVVSETLNDLASFSSPGPTRDGRQKPDLAAPGSVVGAPLTHDFTITCPGSASLYLNDGAQHTIEEGTSMSSPHVAGAAALLLQKYGALTPAQAKAILFARAKTDGFTGATWNKDWGHGKLFLGDLTDPVAQVLSPNGGEELVVGSPAMLTWSATDAYLGVTAVDLELSRDGGSSWETIATDQPNTGSYTWTVSDTATTTALLRVTARDAALNAGQDVSDTTFSIRSLVAVPESPISEFALSLAGGNPVRGSGRISYDVPRASRIKVEAFDVQGRLVATLADGPHAPGRYEVRFGGSMRARSGVFFVRLTTPDRVINQQVVFLR